MLYALSYSRIVTLSLMYRVSQIWELSTKPFSLSVREFHLLAIDRVEQVEQRILDENGLEGPRYRVVVVHKEEVPPFGPQVPKDYLFDSLNLRDFVITKAQNLRITLLSSYCMFTTPRTLLLNDWIEEMKIETQNRLKMFSRSSPRKDGPAIRA